MEGEAGSTGVHDVYMRWIGRWDLSVAKHADLDILL